eukprot:2679675-Prymnesium_polylepis.1
MQPVNVQFATKAVDLDLRFIAPPLAFVAKLVASQPDIVQQTISSADACGVRTAKGAPVNRLHVPETAVRIPGTYLVSKAVDEVKYRDPPRANADELFAVHLVKETLESDALEYCRLRVPPCTYVVDGVYMKPAAAPRPSPTEGTSETASPCVTTHRRSSQHVSGF